MMAQEKSKNLQIFVINVNRLIANVYYGMEIIKMTKVDEEFLADLEESLKNISPWPPTEWDKMTQEQYRWCSFSVSRIAALIAEVKRLTEAHKIWEGEKRDMTIVLERRNFECNKLSEQKNHFQEERDCYREALENISTFFVYKDGKCGGRAVELAQEALNPKETK